VACSPSLRSAQPSALRSSRTLQELDTTLYLSRPPVNAHFVHYRPGGILSLKRYQKDGQSSRGKIFTITRNRIFQIVKDISKKAGIEKDVHPHTLRHSYAVNYLMKGGNLRNLQLNLGHSDLNITAQYLQVTAQDRKNEYEKIMV